MAKNSSHFGLLTCVAIVAVIAALWTRPPSSTEVVPAELAAAQQRSAPTFDLSDVSIPVAEIRGGGPPKDGIPAITDPQVMPPEDASFLKGDERVVGVAIGEASRAYPISILTQHEIVNDTLSETPLAVTYCPLCDSIVVFDRRTPLGEKEFGVSGLLYNSNVLMYDRSEKESLWSQMRMEGVSGPAKGVKLDILPMELTTWASWKARYPKTDVMSNQTGFPRNYSKNPYAKYFRQPGLMFPAQPLNNNLPLKEPVLAIWDDSLSTVVPAARFRGKSGKYSGSLNDKQFEIAFDADSRSLRVISSDEGLTWVNSYWFAWFAFHPNTTISQ